MAAKEGWGETGGEEDRWWTKRERGWSGGKGRTREEEKGEKGRKERKQQKQSRWKKKDAFPLLFPPVSPWLYKRHVLKIKLQYKLWMWSSLSVTGLRVCVRVCARAPLCSTHKHSPAPQPRRWAQVPPPPQVVAMVMQPPAEAVWLRGGTEESRHAPTLRPFRLALFETVLFLFLCPYQSLPLSPLSTVITPQTGHVAGSGRGCRATRGGGADTHLLHTSISNLLMQHFHPSILINTCHPTWQVDRCNLQAVSSIRMRTPGRIFKLCPKHIIF